jgi:hypothetical protein
MSNLLDFDPKRSIVSKLNARNRYIFNRAHIVWAYLGSGLPAIESLINDIKDASTVQTSLSSKSTTTDRLQINMARIGLLVRLDFWDRTWIFVKLQLKGLQSFEQY